MRVAEKDANTGEPIAMPIVIKKYANRRLYNTAKSSYVTLDHLAQMVRDGQDFVVNDAKTGEDITRGVLAQIIFEVLRQLVREEIDAALKRAGSTAATKKATRRE